MNRRLPQAVEMFLGGLVGVGQRNSALYSAAIAWLGAGAPWDQVEAELTPAAMRYGLPAPEIASVLQSARNSKAAANGAKNATDAPPSRRKYEHQFLDRSGPRRPVPPVRPTPPHTSTTDLPPIVPNGARALIDALFRPGEPICFRPQQIGDDGTPTWAGKGENWTYESITDQLGKHAPSKIFGQPAAPGGEDCGLGVVINPASGPGLRNVTAFRHGLLEWDQGTLDEQWQWITATGLPISAVVFSGGKSLHAAVRFDAPDEATFRARAQAALEHIARLNLPAPDKCLADPSRSIRFPDYPRGDARQELLHLAIGAASWGDWVAEHGDPLPTPLDLDNLLCTDWDNDPDNLLGRRWLCRSRSAILVGSSGTGKSTLILTAAVRWALGRDFHGLGPSAPIKILYIQAENDNGDVGEMLQGLVGHAFRANEWEAARKNLVFVTESGASGERFLGRLARLLAIHRPDLVIADPLLSYAGADITKLETIAQFFRNGINPILEQSSTRPGMIWVHHTGKPIADAKARQHWTDSDVQYLGIGSSDLTNWARSILVLQRVKTDDEDDLPTFCLQAVKRGNRAQLKDYDGLASTRIFLRHSDQGQSWLACPDPKTQPKDSESSPTAHRPRKDWSHLQALLPMSRKDLMSWLEKEGFAARQMLHKLTKSGIIKPDPHIPNHFAKP